MSDQRVRVLLVEDEPSYAELHSAMLTGTAVKPFEVVHAPRFSEAEQKLKAEKFDVVLLDLTLPDRMGLNTFSDMKSLAPVLPIVVLTGCNDDKLANEAVRNGAQDYLIKGEFDPQLLARVIRYAIERKRAEVELREREEFFRLILENMQDLVVVLDQQGLLLYASPSCRRYLGDPAMLKGKNPFAQIHAEDRKRVIEAFQEAQARGVGQRVEYRFLCQDGSVRHVESLGNMIRNQGGAPSNMVVVSRDITERKEAVEVLRDALSDLKKSHEELKATQTQLIQAERLEAVSTFAAGVAHEVRNPLQTVILGLNHLADRGGTHDRATPEVVADMEKAVQHVDGIIRGLLEISNCRQREIEEEDLNSIVEQALPAVQNEIVNGRIRLVKDLADGLPKLRMDRRTLKHVFINLFASTIRDMSAGGNLAVRTYSQDLGRSPAGEFKLPAHFQPEDTVVVAEVEETAHKPWEGYAEDAVNHLTGTPRGTSPTGLGFPVLKKIIELHGGVIEAVRREPGTSKFTILFKAGKRPAS